MVRVEVARMDVQRSPGDYWGSRFRGENWMGARRRLHVGRPEQRVRIPQGRWYEDPPCRCQAHGLATVLSWAERARSGDGPKLE